MTNFEKTLGELQERLVIVEGKKDEKALQSLGITDIIPINGRPLFTLVQGIANKEKEVVILTDFDQQGRRLNARLMTLLQRQHVPTNLRIRRTVGGFGKRRIEDFSSLPCEMSAIPYKLRGDNNGEISANIDKVYNQGKNTGKRSYRKARCYRSSVRTDRRSARN